MYLIKKIYYFFKFKIYNNILLLVSPWNYSPYLRKLILNLFFIETKIYNYQNSLDLIERSNLLKKKYFKDAKAFSNRYFLIIYSTKFINTQKNCDFAEFGVFEGLTLNLFAKNLKNKKCYGFDSFEGLPVAWGNILPKGYFKTDILKSKHKNIIIIPGKYEDILVSFLSNYSGKFDLIHIDCDLYSSTKFIFDNIYSKLYDTSFLIMDEFYGYPSYEKYEYKAFFEFVSKFKLNYQFLGYSNKSVLVKLTKNLL